MKSGTHEAQSGFKANAAQGMTTAQPQPPSSMNERDIVLEARVAQMERSFRNRGVPRSS